MSEPKPLLKKLIAPIVAFSALVGAFLFRMRGGSLGPSLPRPLEQALFCLPYAPLAYLSLESVLGHNLYWHIGVAFLVYAAAVIAVLKGHGRNMDLAHYNKPNSETEPEWYEFTIKWLIGRVPEYWYDAVGIGVSGLTYTLVPGIALMFASPLLGVLVLLSGALKSPAYMIGWAIHDWAEDKGYMVNKEKGRGIKGLPYHIDHATGIGEALTGFFIWPPAVASIILLII